jgi:hypothetical protein
MPLLNPTARKSAGRDTVIMGHLARGHLHHWRFHPSLIEFLTRELAPVHILIV